MSGRPQEHGKRLGREQRLQPTHAIHVRLDELQRLVPVRAGDVDDGVEPPEAAVGRRDRWGPQLPEPGVLFLREPHDVVHRFVGQRHRQQPPRRVVERERHAVQRLELVGQERHRRRQKAHCLVLAVALGVAATLPRVGRQGREEVLRQALVELAQRPSNPRRDAVARETELFRRSEHLPTALQPMDLSATALLG